MTPCPLVSQLESLLTEQLTGAERAVVDNHVQDCSSCQEVIESLLAASGPPLSGVRVERVEEKTGVGRLRVCDDPTRTQPVQQYAPRVPLRVPGYEVLSELGHGGMGVVYHARQTRLNREVALKMLRAGACADARDLARFRAEAEAVARLQHAHIVQVYESGEADGQPYLCLEYVAGGTLKDRLGGNPQPGEVAAGLVEMLARAVHFAHERGIVHRDLKPANVLLGRKSETRNPKSETGGTAVSDFGFRLSDFEPKVTDFGLVKWLDRDQALTETGHLAGTPSYMAPEQAAGRGEEVGPRTDVWALGVILYECLTGRPPFQAPEVMDTLLQVCEAEPVPPSRLNSKVPRDLETVCLKCLEKQPARRYASAEELAEELRRFRAGEPIRARPPGLAGRAWKWARRSPLQAALLAVGTAALLAAVVALVGWRYAVGMEEKKNDAERANARAEELRDAEKEQRGRAEAARAEAEQLSHRLDRQLYFTLVMRALAEWRSSDVAEARRLLDRCQEAHRDWEWYDLRGLCAGNPRTLRLQDGAICREVAYSPDGASLYALTGDRVATWNLRNNPTEAIQPLRPWPADASTSLSPDGRRVAVVTPDQGVAIHDAGAPEAPLPRSLVPAANVTCVRFSADGSRVAVSAGGVVSAWDAATGKSLASFRPDAPSSQRLEAAVSPDGSRVAVTMFDSIDLWDTVSGRRVRPMRTTGSVHRLVFSPDGRRLIAACGPLGKSGLNGHDVRLWDGITGAELLTLRGHTAEVLAAAFSADSRRLATASADQTVGLWDVDSGRQLQVYRGHTGKVLHVAFSPDGQTLASTSADGTVRLWNTAGGRDGFALSSQALAPLRGRSVAFTPTGNRLVANDGLGAVWIVGGLADSPAPTTWRALREATTVSTWGLPFAPGTQMASVDFAGTVRIWDVDSGKVVNRLDLPAPFAACLDVSRDGRRLAGAGTGLIRLWDTESSEETHTLTGSAGTLRRLAFDPTGKRLAASGDDRMLRIWDADTGRLLHTCGPHVDPPLGVSFDHAGRTVAAAGGESVVVWDAVSGQKLRELKPAARAFAVAFDPGGKRLAVGTPSSVVLYDAASGDEVFSLRADLGEGRGTTVGLTFSPDGEWLAAISSKGLWLWEAARHSPASPAASR